MGFMGLNHWVESDNAADFRWKINSTVQKLIEKELKNLDFDYNTPGPINIALLIEGGSIVYGMITAEQTEEVLTYLKKIKEDSNDFKSEFTRLLKSVEKFLKKMPEIDRD